MIRFKEWSTKVKIAAILLSVIYVFVWLVAGFVAGRNSAQASEVKSPIGSLINENIIPTLADVPNPINGVFYTKSEASAWKKRIPLAVMVENSVAARPHSSLSKAEVVYEALVEGSVTRFVVVFLANKSSKDLGPVRSARKYYFNWAREYDAAYAHWGGNEGVRSEAQAVFGKRDFDQFSIGSPTFFRRPPYGEHSAYTTTKGLWKVASSRGVNKPTKFVSWKFKQDTPAKKPKAAKITLGFEGRSDMIVEWVYKPKTNTYKRLNGGVAHKDKVYKKQLSAKTIIVQYVKNLGDVYVTGVSNRNFQTTGTNKLLVFRDGKVIQGNWRKKNKNARTLFFNKKGKEISLNRGPIWVEIVPIGSPVSYK
jgi:hypothetical protein